ncbi:MAG: nuclear transport factor 2 family protein [Stenotrophobium sp.]
MSLNLRGKLAGLMTVAALLGYGPGVLAQKLDPDLSSPPPVAAATADASVAKPASAAVTAAPGPAPMSADKTPAVNAPPAAAAAAVTAATPESAPLPASGATAAVVAEQFHDFLRQGLREQALELLAPDVVIFESGYGENTRDGYARNGHLDDDMRFAAGTVRMVDQRTIISSDAGDLTCVMLIARVLGQYEKQPVNLVQSETMLLRRTDAGWRIVHIHWSGHPGKE